MASPERLCSGVHPMATLPISASVGPRTCHLLAVDIPAAASGGAKLVKLGIECLPIGADAGVADEVFFGMSFSHILRQPQLLDRQEARRFAESTHTRAPD